MAAGDITNQGSTGDELTANLIENAGEATVFTLGDNVHESGTLQDFLANYDPSWGKFLNRTHPAIGNHEYLTGNASGFFQYFGLTASPANKGYYSVNVGTWHVVVLNSNCGEAGGCGKGSPQGRWLSSDLNASKAKCTIAIWHHPFFSSGEWQSQPGVKDFFEIIYDNDVEMVLSGHNHDYERYAPQTAEGNYDSGGVVQFVVGTGGANHTPMVPPFLPNLVTWNNTDFGVLRLTLFPGSYKWKFLPVKGASFTDSGEAACH